MSVSLGSLLRLLSPLRNLAVLGAGLCLLGTDSALAEGRGLQERISQKQEDKRSSQWTLAEWMNTKEQMRLMDQWLMMNTEPSRVYEFYLGYEPSSYLDNEGLSMPRSAAVDVAAYATLAGISGSYLLDQSGWDAGFRLRLLGTSDQGTNLTLEYGLIHRQVQGEGQQNEMASVFATLGLTEAFGIVASYRRILPKETSLGQSVDGQRVRAGVFIDFGILRLQGLWFRESLGLDGQAETSEGLLGTLGFYF